MIIVAWQGASCTCGASWRYKSCSVSLMLCSTDILVQKKKKENQTSGSMFNAMEFPFKDCVCVATAQLQRTMITDSIRYLPPFLYEDLDIAMLCTYTTVIYRKDGRCRSTHGATHWNAAWHPKVQWRYWVDPQEQYRRASKFSGGI
jgi:hypothetical protein